MRMLDVAPLWLCASAPLRSPRAGVIQRKDAKTLRRKVAGVSPGKQECCKTEGSRWEGVMGVARDWRALVGKLVRT